MLAFVSRKSGCRAWAISVLAVVIELSPLRAAAQTYAITDLGTLCDGTGFDCPTGSKAFDVNNWGQVVGTALWNGAFVCFRTSPNQPINPPTDRLSFPSGAQNLPCIGYSINDNGSVVGTSWKSPSMASFDARAFVYGSSMVTLSTLLECNSPNLGCLGSYGYALNSTGTIVGGGDFYPDVFHAFRVNLPVAGCCFNDLGALPLTNLANGSNARAVNDSDVIVGSSWAPPGGVVERAVRFGDGQGVSDLGTLGGSQCLFCSSAANAINNVTPAEVVGWSTLSVSGPRHAFSRRLLRADAMVDLGDLCPRSEHGLCRSEAFGINDFGEIVGESEPTYGDQSTHAFVYRAQTGVMEDLNSSLSPLDRDLWELTDARGINDLGQIVGTGVYSGNQNRAYRLDPPPIWLVTNLDGLLGLFGLADGGLEQSLHDSLRTLQNALARDDRAGACGQSDSLDQQARAQVGRGLTPHQATIMMAGAALLQRKLSCRRSD